MKSNREDEAKNLFVAISEAISNDEELADEILISNGKDPKKIEAEGEALFQKYLLRIKLSQASEEKTALLRIMVSKVTDFLQAQSETVSSVLLPNKVGSRQEVVAMLCNKFTEYHLDDIEGILEDEAVAHEMQKFLTQKP